MSLSLTHQNSIILKGPIVTRSLQQIKPEIPGDIWQIKPLQVASVLQEHRATARQVLRHLVSGRIRICLALQGAPAICLPCKRACKAPKLTQSFPRGGVSSKSEVYVTGTMSQDPKAFILGPDRRQKSPKVAPGTVCKGNAPADIPGLTRTSLQRHAAKAVRVHS